MESFQYATDAAVLAELGERLARVRLRRDQTQEQLADAAGVSRRTVARLEAGESTQLTNLVRVLRALELLDGLAAFAPPPGPSPLEQLRNRGRERKRASGTSRDIGTDAEWTWGDDAPAPSDPGEPA